jgi:hypothetical protein
MLMIDVTPKALTSGKYHTNSIQNSRISRLALMQKHWLEFCNTKNGSAKSVLK